ncbi:MAG: FHA domain-containing protein [Gaiellales bacterium]
MVEQLLLALKVGFVVLLYLFIWRVIRVASRDMAAGQESMILAPLKTPKPAPQAPRRAPGRLIVTRSPELREGSVITLSHELFAGREAGLDIPLPADGYASHRHARFVRANDTDAVEDLQSTNGTYVNGERLDGLRPLSPGDLITIGQTQLTYQNGDA